jgi:hypothetical protein
MEKGSKIVYAGWLDRKGTSMITPWTTRWVVLTLDSVKHYSDDQMTKLKGELIVDDTTRIIIAENETYNNYRFAITTATDCLEFGVNDLDIRNMWIQKCVHIAERKSELGAFVMRVTSDTEYRNAFRWESIVIAHSIDESSGLPPQRTPPPKSASKKNPPIVRAPRSDEITASFASFAPYDTWLAAFEPDVKQAKDQAVREEESRKQSNKIADPSSIERIKDYMVESIVTNITAVSTTKSCNLLLEGMCQLIAASERQLARTYRQCREQEALALASGGASPVVTPKSSTVDIAGQQQDGDKKLSAEEEIPLAVQEDLLCTLGSLRALILSYRFYDAARDVQMRFTRRLAVHQLERSLSRVLKSLEDLQEKEQAALAAQTAEATAIALASEVTGLVIDDASAVPAKIVPAETLSAQEKSLQARKASLRQLRRIMRPLLSREFLQLEAAPLLQDFMTRNSSSMKQMEGLAAEVTNTFGAMVQAFVEKKITDMEEAVIQQVEEFVNVISEYSEKKEEPKSSADLTAEDKEVANVSDFMGTGIAIPASSHEVMVRLAQEKAAVDKKIAKIKMEGSILWDGTDKSLVEMVLLEQTDALYAQLQDSVKMCISGGLYALLDMAGGGLSAAAAAAHAAQTPGSTPTPTPAPAPAPAPASSGYFF